MEKIKVKVLSRSNATSRAGELCPVSGIVEFEDTYSHISALVNMGETVQKVVAVIAPEPIKEEVISLVRSVPAKKKKLKG